MMKLSTIKEAIARANKQISTINTIVTNRYLKKIYRKFFLP
jgi:hypothetical protein